MQLQLSATKSCLLRLLICQKFPDRYILLESREIEITVNQPEPIDIIGLQVEQLREQKQKTVADAQQRIAAIDDKIQQLLCIEYTPDTDELPY